MMEPIGGGYVINGAKPVEFQKRIDPLYIRHV